MTLADAISSSGHEQLSEHSSDAGMLYVPGGTFRMGSDRHYPEEMPVIADRVYGIPPEQVVGSSGVTKFAIRPNGTPVLTKEPKIQFVDDGPGKPEGIDRFIGRRPIFAFGNSDGDWQMLQWTAAGGGACFMGLVHHIDAECEYAYAKQQFNTLDKALDEANAKGWMVVDMKNDWRTIFPAGGVR